MDFQFVGGCLKDKRDKRDFRIAGIQAPVSLPYEFYLDGANFPPKMQWSRPSCTSQAQATHKERQERVKLSARYIMAKTKELEGNTGWGAYIRNTFKAVNQFGAPEEHLLPEPEAVMSWQEYLKPNFTEILNANAARHKSGSYWRVETRVEAIKQSIYQNKQSVSIGIPWFSSYNRPNQDGTLPPPDRDSLGHAIEVIGWKGNQLRCKNSFGENWGDHGYFWYEDSPQRKIWDAWTSLDLPEKYPVDDKYGQVRTWAGYLREKSFAFNLWLHAEIKRLPNNREINALAYGYHPFENVFRGAIGDKWLYMTWPEYKNKYLFK